MGKGIWPVMKKELARFFKDRRLCLTTLLLPGLMIYVIYSFMGDALGSQFTVSEDYTYQIEAIHLPDSVAEMSEELPVQFRSIDPSQQADALNAVQNQELDLLLIFPQDFDAQVAAYDVSSEAAAPNVEIYYNSAATESSEAYDQVTALLEAHETAIANKFDINRGSGTYDLADAQDLAGMTFASLMPMLIMIFLFSGCTAVAPESIAGEKERGTIATILVTPIHRSELALGKIFSLSIIALLSGLSSTIGVLLSMPKLMGGMDISMTVYGLGDYAMLGLVVLSTVLLLIALISIISAFAKSTKEAQTLIMPLMIIVMVIGVSGMFGEPTQDSLLYLIPLYGSVQSMAAIFAFDFNMVHTAICVISTLCYAAACIFVLTRMFHSERIIFTR